MWNANLKMKKMDIQVKTIALTPGLFIIACNQHETNGAQKLVLETIRQLSETTAPGGGGAVAYARFLSDDYSRWTIGSTKTYNKEEWVDGVREWFTEGWRVSDRK